MKKEARYSAERVIGNGSFGIVYQAVVNATKEVVAIKKVLQDKRYKNRELKIMQMVKHPNVVNVIDCFFSHGSSGKDLYLNIVMEYIPETVYQTIKSHSRASETIPFPYIQCYAYQICRALAYVHSLGICHRDIKPQNLLLDPETHIVKLCDFGSAKILEKGLTNVAYICSRYYRAPELIFESSHYTQTIDIWSLGCVIAELFLGKPLFQGGSGVDQLVEIIKVLGSPSRADILAMNPSYKQFTFPKVKAMPWTEVFKNVTYKNRPMPRSAVDLIKSMLVFQPDERLDSFDALGHDFFASLRISTARLPNGKRFPPLFNFSPNEKALIARQPALAIAFKHCIE